MADFILALDQGTSSSRAILFDHSGAIRAVAQREFKQHYPHPGWVEHDPNEIWETQLETARAALKDAGASFQDVAAIGITNQRETTVIWDTDGRPIHNAIVWQDRRTAAFCDELKAKGLEPTFREKTGLLIDPYFSGTKARWLLDNVDGARKRAERGDLMFGTIDSWLLYKLCRTARPGGVHATDYTNASRTLMYNIFERRWDPELLAALDIPASLLPEVRASSGVFGETELLGGKLPVAGVGGDQQAALFGQAAFSPGMAKNTYGTGAFLLLNVGDQPVHSDTMLTTIAWGLPSNTVTPPSSTVIPSSSTVIPPSSTVIPSGAKDAAGDRSAARDPRDNAPTADNITYALEGSIFIAGAAVQWLRDELQVIPSAADSATLASTVPDSNGVYVVPAFVGLGAPHWDPNARGAILGLTRGANRAHIVRATLEAIAYQVRDVVEAMEHDSGTRLAELRVDGGAAANDLLLQMQADTLGRDVVRPAVLETTALGAAYLAGLATGFWKDPAELAENWREDRRFTPQMSEDQRESMYAGWLKAVDRAKSWATD